MSLIAASLPAGLQNSLNGIAGVLGQFMFYVILIGAICWVAWQLIKKVPLLGVALGLVFVVVLYGWSQSPETFKSDVNTMVTP